MALSRILEKEVRLQRWVVDGTGMSSGHISGVENSILILMLVHFIHDVQYVFLHSRTVLFILFKGLK